MSTQTPARRDNRETSPAEIKEYLSAAEQQIASMLPNGMTADKVIQVVALCAYANPLLLKCRKASILESVMRASALGLDLSPGLMEAALVPRWSKDAGGYVCTYQSMYQGLIKLAMQSDKVEIIRTALVYEGDNFTYRFEEGARGAGLRLIHEPCLRGQKGEIVGAYAVGKLASGETLIEYMSREELEVHRDRFAPRNKQGAVVGPWTTDFAAMCRKTVAKAVCKYLPKSVALSEAIAQEYVHEPQAGPAIEAEPKARTTRAEALTARLTPPGLPALEMAQDDDEDDSEPELDDEAILRSEGGNDA